MKIHISKLKPVALNWIDKVVYPKCDPLQIFGLCFVLAQMGGKLDQYIESAKIFADQDGNIDLSEAAANARTALKKAGGSFTIPVLNWDFDGDDLEALLAIAKEHAND